MDTKILQFGEGNFLRCFFDRMVQKLNERTDFNGAVQIIQPRADVLKDVALTLNSCGGRYHVCLRGIKNGKPVEEFEEISCVKGVDLWTNLDKYATLPSLRFIVSNTTEAGIQYVKDENTFPAKVLRLLKARHSAGMPGLVFIPCELIENNGNILKKCILEHLRDDNLKHSDYEALVAYIERDCIFCSTLVDQIVSGRPEPESAKRYARLLGVNDEALVCGEPFHFLAVETPEGFDLESEMPLLHAGINVAYAGDIGPYRTRKIRFLNAVHTSMVYRGLESGYTEVAQCLNDEIFLGWIRKMIFDEIFPTVNLPDSEKREYAESVLERFANPYAHHRLESIALNTISKWKTRCLPVICDYYRITGHLPQAMLEGYEAIARHYDLNK